MTCLAEYTAWVVRTCTGFATEIINSAFGINNEIQLRISPNLHSLISNTGSLYLMCMPSASCLKLSFNNYGILKYPLLYFS